MALPVTSRNRYTNRADPNGRWLYKRTQLGYVQTKPIDRVLGYWNSIAETSRLKYNEVDVGDAASLAHPTAYSQYNSAVTQVSNRAYEKLRAETANAQIGVNIVEYRQARDMFRTRIPQFLGLGILLARGKFASAGKMLGASFYDGKPPRRNRNNWVLPDFARKTNVSASNLYLEWHFGVSPMISDCQDAMKVLTDPIPKHRIRGGSMEFVRINRLWLDTSNPGGYEDERWATRIRYRQGADVAITNPNLALAGQLGLINPASLAWEIVPFSFVADWFVNVGDWLQGFSDFAGMTLQNAYTSADIWTFKSYTKVVHPWNTNVWYTGYCDGKYRTLNRTVGLTGPVLAVRPLKLPSMTRVATAWSLVSQMFSKHR